MSSQRRALAVRAAWSCAEKTGQPTTRSKDPGANAGLILRQESLASAHLQLSFSQCKQLEGEVQAKSLPEKQPQINSITFSKHMFFFFGFPSNTHNNYCDSQRKVSHCNQIPSSPALLFSWAIFLLGLFFPRCLLCSPVKCWTQSASYVQKSLTIFCTHSWTPCCCPFMAVLSFPLLTLLTISHSDVFSPLLQPLVPLNLSLCQSHTICGPCCLLKQEVRQHGPLSPTTSLGVGELSGDTHWTPVRWKTTETAETRACTGMQSHGKTPVMQHGTTLILPSVPPRHGASSHACLYK